MATGKANGVPEVMKPNDELSMLKKQYDSHVNAIYSHNRAIVVLREKTTDIKTRIDQLEKSNHESD